MSTSSSSSSRIKRYHVFPSFHGPDVRRGILSHLHNHFARTGITTFKDQEIERGQTIGPELVQAIRESRLSIVLLSKNYASSSWCLDELLEILKCREDEGQLVMTIFYDVDPTDVRKQRGDFGTAFMKTCQGKTEEEKQRWSKALAYVATVAGEHSLHWTDEAAMVEKFSTDVSNKLNVTLSGDFDNIVGLQTHLRKLSTLLCIECSEVKMIGIWGPAGIGKSTIARALFNQLSSDFPLRCFMGNLRGSYKSIVGVDDYDSKLGLQSQLLSMVLNQGNIRVYHLGAIKEWLQDQRVLIILDNVDDLDQLEVLANDLSWFGLGSRIIITTQDKNILKAHGIQDIYHVSFPSCQEALEILCLSAFKQSFVQDGFEEVATRVAELCGNLPLGLCVVGSSLRGESKQEWELQLSRIEFCLDRKIEDVLRVGYDRLSKKNQSIFLHIACVFNHHVDNDDYVIMMLADSNLDVENGLKTLVAKSLVEIPNPWDLKMHSLLQQLGRQIVNELSDEPGKRQFLEDAEEIRDVLANETGTGSVIGISFNMSKINKFSINGRAFEGMRNLRFLRIYKSEDVSLEVSKDMEYLPRLRLLDWTSYPRKSLPPKFQLECLVILCMQKSNLKKLWGGIQPLANLKAIDLSYSSKLKEIPNLSKAINLRQLNLEHCTSLVELPSSIRNLQKLEMLEMRGCVKLRVIPTNINLPSLCVLDMSHCYPLRSYPDFSRNVSIVYLGNTKIEDTPASVFGSMLYIGSRSLKRLTHVPKCVIILDLSNSDIKRIPDCVIGLPHLTYLCLKNCRKLVSLQNLPPSISNLDASNCGSLKSICFSFDIPKAYMTPDDSKCVQSEEDARWVSSYFDKYGRGVELVNCLSLDEESRRGILQQYVNSFISLPGKEIPAEFTHRATGNTITISEGTFSASSRFKVCLLLSSTEQVEFQTVCRLRSKGILINERKIHQVGLHSGGQLLMDHLFIYSGSLFENQRCLEKDATASEIQFEFDGILCEKIIECGIQIMAEEGESSSSIEPFGLRKKKRKKTELNSIKFSSFGLTLRKKKKRKIEPNSREISHPLV